MFFLRVSLTKPFHALTPMNDKKFFALNTVEQNGIAILQHVTTTPFFNQDFISPHLVITICHEGICKARYDFREVQLRKHFVSITFPQHVLHPYYLSPDYNVTLLYISNKLYNELRTTSGARYLNYNLNSDFPLSETQINNLQTCLDLLKVLVNDFQGNDKYELLRRQLRIFFEMLHAYFLLSHADKAEHARNEHLFSRFYELLIRDFRQTREVAYYAEQLNLSPKYFGTVIKQTTGISAANWISNYVTTQAKAMLNEHRELSLSDIAEQLGFSQLSDFSRYIKRFTGLSPSQFRN